jgi:PilZ domain
MRAKQRKEVRVGLCRAVQLHIGGVRPIAAVLYDVSKSGIALEAPRWIRVGTRVRVDGAGFAAEGEVRYCEPQTHGYRIGISKALGNGKKAKETKATGRFLASDPSVRQGQPTF